MCLSIFRPTIMQPVPQARFFSDQDMNAAFAPTQLGWLDTARSLRDRAGQPIKAALIDPFDCTITIVELETQFQLEDQPYFGKPRKRVNLHPPDELQGELLHARAGIGSVALTEDLQSGLYTLCVAQLAGCTLPKEPGFRVAGRPFVGRALVLRGVELGCPGSLHLLDYHVDVQPEDYVGLEWLSFKEVKAARKQWFKQGQALLTSLEARHDSTLIVNGPPSLCPYDELGTCWGCNTVNAAQRKCSTCRCAYYCNVSCQKAHWRVHKQTCKQAEHDEQEEATA